MEVGASGQFDVLLGDELVASKTRTGLVQRLLGNNGFPDEGAVIAELRGRLVSVPAP
jgi:hypothetical protein